MIILILKSIFLFIAFSYGFSNIGNLLYGNSVDATKIYCMSIGIVGFIVLQFIM